MEASPELEKHHGLCVHSVLAQGYLTYLAAIVLGFGASSLWPETISIPFESSIGAVLIMAGTFLVYWAQRASNKTFPAKDLPKEEILRRHLSSGPYAYTRMPTQYGLFIMALGLALVFGSLYMVIGTVLALGIGKFIVIPIEERHLAELYGDPYLDYKKKVRF